MGCIIPKELVMLGSLLEIEFDDGSDQDRIFKISPSESWGLFSAVGGRSLFAFPVKRSPKKTTKYVERANELFERWAGYGPGETLLLLAPPGRLREHGRVKRLDYGSDKWTARRNEYTHTFDQPPKLWISGKKSAPGAIALTGGQMRIEKEGLIG